MRILFVCSTGGHLAQLLALRPWWEDHDRLWVTFDKEPGKTQLADENVVWGHHPTTRNVPNLFRNAVLATKVLRSYKPDVVVSTGAGLAIPYFPLGKLFGARTVYLEVYDRIDTPTMTGRVCYPFADLFCLQWEEQRRIYPKGVVVGRTL